MLYIMGPVSAPEWSVITAFRVEVTKYLLARAQQLQQVVEDQKLFSATLLDGSADYFAFDYDEHEDWETDGPVLREMREDEVEPVSVDMCQMQACTNGSFVFQAVPKGACFRSVVETHTIDNELIEEGLRHLAREDDGMLTELMLGHAREALDHGDYAYLATLAEALNGDAAQRGHVRDVMLNVEE